MNPAGPRERGPDPSNRTAQVNSHVQFWVSSSGSGLPEQFCGKDRGPRAAGSRVVRESLCFPSTCGEAAGSALHALERPELQMKASNWGRTFALGSLLSWPVILPACASTAQEAEGPSGPGIERRNTVVEHEPCDHEDENAVARDANRDGKPDLITVTLGGRPVCQWIDLNFDGVVDAWTYFDSNGQVRRRETDYDRDGRIDEVATWQGGVMVARERATTLAGRLDTWEYFERGVLVRAERDADGNGMVDQWWEYMRAQRPDCPVVHSDVDGDGRPEPGATVDLCEAELASDETAGLSQAAREQGAPDDTTQSAPDVPNAAEAPPQTAAEDVQ